MFRSKDRSKPITETYIFPEIRVVFNITFSIIAINVVKSYFAFPKNVVI